MLTANPEAGFGDFREDEDRGGFCSECLGGGHARIERCQRGLRIPRDFGFVVGDRRGSSDNDRCRRLRRSGLSVTYSSSFRFCIRCNSGSRSPTDGEPIDGRGIRTSKVVLFVMFTKQALPCRSRPPVQCKECTSTAGREDTPIARIRRTEHLARNSLESGVNSMELSAFSSQLSAQAQKENLADG